MNLIKRIFSRRRLWDDLSEEIQGHLQEKTNELIAQGLSRKDAALAARREFGNTMRIEERGREVWRWPWIESVLADVRYCLRQFGNSPGFTTVAVLTLALGIGANTALFSVVNGVLLSPLAYPDPDQLVTIHESKPDFAAGSISFPNFRDWQKDNHTFSGMAVARPSAMILTGFGDAEQETVEFVSSDIFRVLGIKPMIGRDFAPGEDQIGAAPIALISEDFWKDRFQADSGVPGKTLALDGKDYTIVGVIPTPFDSINNFHSSRVYLPIGQWGNDALRSRGAGLGIHGIGRLKTGITIQQARADLDGVTHGLALAYPEVDIGVGATLFPLKDNMVGGVRPLLLVLLAAVGFVLLIACLNVANLMLARATSRAREFAIRAALGAGRMRLVRQLLTESVLLFCVGGALGLLFAAWGTQAALKRLPAALPRADHIALDVRVLIFTAGVSLLSGIGFGLAPALKAVGSSLQETMNQASRGLSRARHRAQSILVAVEVALALVLLIGAGLMMRTIAALTSVELGFNPHNVLTFAFSLPPSMNTASPEAIQEALRRVESEFAAIPGIEDVSMTWGAVPLGADDDILFWIDGRPKPSGENEMDRAESYVVEPDYVKAMGISIKRGRFFTAQDDSRSPLVTVVDEAFARKYFPGEDPIGKRLNTDYSGEARQVPARIVGVVSHVKQWALDSDDNQLQAQMYRPFAQVPGAIVSPGAGFIVHSDGVHGGVLDSIREASKRVNSQQVIFQARTMDELVARSLAARQFSMILLGVFAALALVLASVGIYGVMSYWVGQQTHEIGIRMALGAARGRVRTLILGQAVSLAAIGIGIGLAAALALTRLMGGLLYGVSAKDPFTFGGVAVVSFAVAMTACYLPARRAMRVDPIVALRHE
ncbi:MAG TPA: ABC transporter permease [Blastocatellia bacterium]|nr:ABC transporter permease [Blastocatellia bacterium]